MDENTKNQVMDGTEQSGFFTVVGKYRCLVFSIIQRASVRELSVRQLQKLLM